VIEQSAKDGLVQVSRRSLVRLRADAKGIPLRAVRILSRNSGAHLSAFRGRGMEFDESRIYQPGDDIRSLDWRVTARTGQPHTKLFREERERSVLLWVDYRAPMYFATRGRFKSVLASQAATLLAWSARAQGDRLGCLAFSEQGHREIRPGVGDHAVLNLIGLLSDFAGRTPDQSSEEARSGALHSALRRMRRVARPGSLLFLISDFRNLDARAEEQITTLARHSDLLLLHLFDPLESALPTRGRYCVSDGDTSLEIDTGVTAVRQRYHEEFTQRQAQLQQLCRRHGMHLLQCASDGDIQQLLREGLGKRG